MNLKISSVLRTTAVIVMLSATMHVHAESAGAAATAAHGPGDMCGVTHLVPHAPDSAMIAAMSQVKPEAARDKQPSELRAKVFLAKKVITMDPMYPETQAIATLGGRILALGTLEQVKERVKDMPYDTVSDFANAVIYPGFIESHAHAQSAGLQWMTTYLGQMEQMRPDGVVDKGPRTIDELKARIKAAADSKKDGEWVFGWGYDPTILKYDITTADLDPVTGNKPLFILDASMHQAYVNSAALKLAGFDKTTDLKGVIKGKDGQPTGRIEELEVLQQMAKVFPPITKQRMIDAQWTIAKLASRMGITTITDMNFGMIPHGYEAAVETAKDPNFPVRLSAYVLIDVLKDPRVQKLGGFQMLKVLQNRNTDRFRLAGAKFVMDGSSQGGTAVFLWPYYYDGRPNGIYNYEPEALEHDLVALYKLGIQPTIHVNADGALQAVLSAIQDALREAPVIEHRTTLQHVQVANDEQFAWMKRMGVSPNFLINHVYYWGDDWLKSMGGPVKGALIDAAATAKRHDLRFGLHSDHPVTPVDRLLAMSNATNRLSISGAPVGLSERIGVEDALKAITIDAAFLLGEEHQKGSIVIGKLADFTALDSDILAMKPTELRNAKVLGSVVGGVVHKVDTPRVGK